MGLYGSNPRYRFSARMASFPLDASVSQTLTAPCTLAWTRDFSLLDGKKESSFSARHSSHRRIGPSLSRSSWGGSEPVRDSGQRLPSHGEAAARPSLPPGPGLLGSRTPLGGEPPESSEPY